MRDAPWEAAIRRREEPEGSEGDRRTGRVARGFVLPLFLVLLLALTAMAHGCLLLARRELQASGAFRHAVRARWAAEGAPALLPRIFPDSWKQRTPGGVLGPVARATGDGVTGSALLRWLDREFFLLEGTGTSRGWPGRGTLAWVGWSLHPAERVGAFEGVVELGGSLLTTGGGRVTGSGLDALPDLWPPGGCLAYETLTDSLFPGGRLPPVASLRPAPPPVELPDTSGIPSLGLLWGDELLRRTAGGLPSPGAPGAPGCPGTSKPLSVGVEGSASLAGGRYCGMLVVEEDLVMTAGAHVQGLLLVGGELRLEGGSRVEGLARVGADLFLGPGSKVEGRACPVLRVLTERDELRDPLLLPHASRMATAGH